MSRRGIFCFSFFSFISGPMPSPSLVGVTSSSRSTGVSLPRYSSGLKVATYWLASSLPSSSMVADSDVSLVVHHSRYTPLVFDASVCSTPSSSGRPPSWADTT